MGPLWLAKHGPQGQAAFVERLMQLRDYFSELPPERFPNFVGLAAVMLQPDQDDERFEFGHDILVRGIAAHAVPPEPSAPSAGACLALGRR